MTTLNDTRAAFLGFFKGQGHQLLPSSALVPHNDPTLMFTNAGMVQFKNIFTGLEKAPNPPRAATSQKCVRAGGKHNDLDNVGYTARHHTFFEMLGNFSFGDYFKEEAIEFGWNLVTKTFGLPLEKLCVTIYHTDDEAFGYWKKLGMPEGKIIRIATADNFWSMGPTGPCGPCSEIFYDHGEHIPGGPPGSPNEDGDRFIEIWNLVFMQFEQKEDGSRVDLPKPSIDTGMGLERMAAVMQGVHDNYDIDLFKALIHASQELSGNRDLATSHRVIADHLRSSSFLMADGVLPSNEGRGYVLRRIMRRAMRHAHILGCKEPLMYKLVPALVNQMGKAYPELARAERLITEQLRTEEEKFKETLDRGLKILDEETAKLKSGAALPGDVAFKLYDTYGFPLDLTEDILRGKEMTVDNAGFEQAMNEQKAAARAAWSGSGESKADPIWFTLREKHGATEFLGYDATEAEGDVRAIIAGGQELSEVKAGEQVQIITNRTPFYGESGGQMGDHGIIKTAAGQAVVIDTKKFVGDLHVHIAKIEQGSIKVGDKATLAVDNARRMRIRANHSATHLLHAALRHLLGDHVTQKGSLVEEDKLRFDFSHSKALTQQEILAIEQAVNELIRQNEAVDIQVMKQEQALKSGAMALFGEKYGDEVRVIFMGGKQSKESRVQSSDTRLVSSNISTDQRSALEGSRGAAGRSPQSNHYSIEFCGGTHVARTGDMGLFKITSETAIANGVRRIEAVTGEGALKLFQEQEAMLGRIVRNLKTSPEEVESRITALLDERKKLERELADAKKAAALAGSSGGGGSVAAIEEINGVKFIGQVYQDLPAKDVRGVVDELKAKLGSGVVAVVAVNDGKAALSVGVTQDLTERHNAVTLVQAGVVVLGGKGGGGRPDMAQAGGPDAANAQAALDTIKKAI